MAQIIKLPTTRGQKFRTEYQAALASPNGLAVLSPISSVIASLAPEDFKIAASVISTALFKASNPYVQNAVVRHWRLLLETFLDEAEESVRAAAAEICEQGKNLSLEIQKSLQAVREEVFASPAVLRYFATLEHCLSTRKLDCLEEIQTAIKGLREPDMNPAFERTVTVLYSTATLDSSFYENLSGRNKEKIMKAEEISVLACLNSLLAHMHKICPPQVVSDKAFSVFTTLKDLIGSENPNERFMGGVNKVVSQYIISPGSRVIDPNGTKPPPPPANG